MPVTIHIPLIHRHLSDDIAKWTVDGETVGQCLDQLVAKFPQLKAAFFNEQGELQNFIEVFLNSESTHPDELAHPVADGDELYITTILSGG